MELEEIPAGSFQGTAGKNIAHFIIFKVFSSALSLFINVPATNMTRIPAPHLTENKEQEAEPRFNRIYSRGHEKGILDANTCLNCSVADSASSRKE